MIPIYIPYLDKYKDSAISAINSNWISNCGIFIKNAEEKLKKILMVKYCILMNNGTSATHSLFISLKYNYPDIKKVYVPNNVFIAPWNCALMEYSKEQIEVMKIDEKTLNINTDENYIKSLEEKSCVLIVHNLGNIVNVPRLKRLRPDIIFLEDNCEGFLGKYENKFSGTDCLCSAVSFYANKILTTGEGGAFFTNDENIYKYIKSTYGHGMTKERYIHDTLGYNYRMTNIQAGFLYDQLNDIEHILSLKSQLFNNYDILLDNLKKSHKIKKIKNEKNTIPANWMYCIIIKDLNYDNLENYMNKRLIEIRPFFYDIRKHPHLKDIPVNYQECVFNGVMLPSYPGLEIEKQEYISNCITEYLGVTKK